MSDNLAAIRRLTEQERRLRESGVNDLPSIRQFGEKYEALSAFSLAGRCILNLAEELERLRNAIDEIHALSKPTPLIEPEHPHDPDMLTKALEEIADR